MADGDSEKEIARKGKTHGVWQKPFVPGRVSPMWICPTRTPSRHWGTEDQ